MVKIAKIRGCMAEKKDTQKDLAEILDLSERSVNLKMNGKVPFTISEISLIAKRYKKSVNFFLG